VNDDAEFERLSAAKLVFPQPKVMLFWRAEGEFKRIANNDFSAGPLLSIRKKIDEYRALIQNGTNELHQLADAVEWHAQARNDTVRKLRKLRLAYAEAKVQLALFIKAKQALTDEIKELQETVATAKNATVDTPESLLRNEIVSLGATARARSQIAAAMALQKAMSHLTATYKAFLATLKRLAKRTGQSVKVNTQPVKGYALATKKLIDDLKKHDADSQKLRTKASSALRAAIRYRAKEKGAIHDLQRVNAALADEKKRLRHVQKVYNSLKQQLEKLHKKP